MTKLTDNQIQELERHLDIIEDLTNELPFNKACALLINCQALMVCTMTDTPNSGMVSLKDCIKELKDPL